MPAYIVVDTHDPDRTIPFWCELLDVQVKATYTDGHDVVLAPAPSLGGLMLNFQIVPEAKVGKNRVHWDVLVDDLEVGTKRVEALGGRWSEPGMTREMEGWLWRVMADPEGNEFCIIVPTG
jgi:predicted enzyme related to lactoylglutathione lyase